MADECWFIRCTRWLPGDTHLLVMLDIQTIYMTTESRCNMVQYNIISHGVITYIRLCVFSNNGMDSRLQGHVALSRANFCDRGEIKDLLTSMVHAYMAGHLCMRPTFRDAKYIYHRSGCNVYKYIRAHFIRLKGTSSFPWIWSTWEKYLGPRA